MNIRKMKLSNLNKSKIQLHKDILNMMCSISFIFKFLGLNKTQSDLNKNWQKCSK